jgi:competence protein ComEC
LEGFLLKTAFKFLFNSLKRLRAFWGFWFLALALVYSATFKSLTPTPTLKSSGTTLKGVLIDRESRSGKERVSLQDSLGQMHYALVQNPKIINAVPGDTLILEGESRPPADSKTPGVFAWGSWLALKGYQSLWQSQSQSKLQINPAKSSTLIQVPFQIRQVVISTLNSLYPTEQAGFLAALLIGQRGGLEVEIKENFQKTGLFHLLAISGFHVALITIILMMLIQMWGVSKQIAIPVSILILAIYLPVCGGAPSVKRAVLMYGIWSLGKLFYEKSHGINALMITGGLLIFIDPYLLTDAGFQLSFSAVFCIIWLGPLNPLIGSRLSPAWRNNLLNPFLTGFWATLGCAPVLIFHFSNFSFIGLFANLPAVPLVSLILCGGLISLGLGLIHMDLAQLVANSNSLLIDLCEYMAQWFADIPLYFNSLSAWSVSGVITWYAVIILIPLVIRREPGARALTLILLLSISFSYAYQQVESLVNPKHQIWFLDVGQGDATLIELADGRKILIDAGTQRAGERVLLPFFRSRGWSSLDWVIITHADGDHYGGVLPLVQNLKIHQIGMPQSEINSDKAGWKTLLNEINKKQIPLLEVGQGDQLGALPSTIELKFLWPPKNSDITGNEGSTVVLFSQDSLDVLMTGDLGKSSEKKLMNLYQLKGIEIFKAGHHGSAHSSDSLFLATLQAELAIISAGRYNRYGHPAPRVVELLNQLNIPYRETAFSGTQRVEFNTKGWSLK